MRISFVLPAPIRIPMGGAKVVYQHAARFATQGHSVVVVMPMRTGNRLAGWVRHAAVQVRDRLHGVSASSYYEARGVQSLVVPSLNAKHVPFADIVIATGFQTAMGVVNLPKSHGTKVYYLQGLETFVHRGARASWQYPMARITCARWLADEVEREGVDVLGVVPNAVDPAEFYEEVAPVHRGAQVAALYHRHPVKGPDVLIEALTHLREHRQDLEVDVFSARPPSHTFPDGVRVHVRPSVPDVRALYNQASILLHPSRSEGWGLVPMEAAACGTAIVSSANPGIAEFLTDGISVQCVPIGDGIALADAALRLLGDPDARVRQAKAGQAAVARFRLDELSDRFLNLLASLV
ncbi:MAG: glycosyltransferase family 4 protein [Bacteroidota bacterium]